MCEKLFDVTIVEAHGEEAGQKIQTWHKDVQFFHVLSKDDSNEHIASFFLDPFSRPEEKQGGAWMAVCRQRSDLLNRKPVAYLTCNGTPPVNGAPSLMTFNDFCTLFHEFGHGLQHMLTKVPFSDAAGISGIEWDAVELPSQFMENWCYHKKTVDNFAKHYETGEKLPDTLFQKVCDAKTFCWQWFAGSVVLWQNGHDATLYFRPFVGCRGHFSTATRPCQGTRLSRLWKETVSCVLSAIYLLEGTQRATTHTFGPRY